jgi:hypothetical protein
VFVLLAIAVTCFADQSVNGYTRKDGTYVNSNTRSKGVLLLDLFILLNIMFIRCEAGAGSEGPLVIMSAE